MAGRVEHYRVLERIGRGGLGETYAARDETLDRPVVLKVVHDGRVADDAARQRFMRTVRAAAALSHPQICRIYEVLEVDGQPLVVMEQLRGETVARRTASSRPIEPREVCRLGRELAEGLAAAHAAGLVHGNISAANVMITVDGHVKLMDLGLAETPGPGDRAESPAGPGVHSRTMMLGTPVYLAPELFKGGSPSAKSDLYAVGVVLYRMATGMLPFAERMTADSLAEMLSQPPVPPSLLVAGLPSSLERAIMGLLEKTPDARFPSAESLAATLALPQRSER